MMLALLMQRTRGALAAAAFAAGALVAGSAQAATVQWTDWHTAGANTVRGSIGAITVRFTSPNAPIAFAITGGGTDYWVDNGYTQGLVNRPTGTDIIALDQGGTRTILFSQAVNDVYLAFTSWNGNTAVFSQPFSVVAQGCGYWGCGSFAVNGSSDGFFGLGEVHGVLKFAGPVTSLSFGDSSENWHGLTVGIGVASGVPEPSTWAMMLIGFAGLGLAARRRRMDATA
ncbi:MAG: PEP-CTERM sorting domain-containing protein [Methylobacteriaceae bacterium]|nr:PEP-CTERM sorting domain-containing protein [Methylobacteriaceae bacterium]